MLLDTRVNKRLSYCRMCGKPVFRFYIDVPGIGWRNWWHEDEAMDSQHAAEPIPGRYRGDERIELC